MENLGLEDDIDHNIDINKFPVNAELWASLMIKFINSHDYQLNFISIFFLNASAP
jgi:hypothetical protein